ncbi:MAG: DUF4412 domain-containing protein [Bacteroidales bacterium]|jgi:hypothetical protein|nr:DUF4412 domain-containing protein [Bacteroidales bacterium]
MTKATFLRNLIATAVCFTAFGAATSVRAQSYYAEEYIKKSGKLSKKIWVSHESDANLKMRTETFEIGFGLKKDDNSYIVVRMDSAKMFTLYPDTKTYTYWDLSSVMKDGSLTSMINGNVGAAVMKSSSVKSELLGTEVIEGYECKHYRYAITTTLANGTSETGYREAWVYEPLKIEMQWEDGGEVFFIRNLKPGAQPASLFVIPKDYKGASAFGGNFGGLSGKASDADVQQKMKEIQDALNSGNKSKTDSKDKDKADAEKIQELMNMLGGQKK